MPTPIQPTDNQVITSTNCQPSQQTSNLPTKSSSQKTSHLPTTSNQQLTRHYTSLDHTSATNLPPGHSFSFFNSPYLVVAIVCGTVVLIIVLILGVVSVWLAVYWKKRSKQQAYITEEIHINDLIGLPDAAGEDQCYDHQQLTE